MGIAPSNIYLFKVNNGNTKTISEICSSLIIKTPERRIDIVLTSLLLILNKFLTLF